jgi:hypothetical protein
MVGKKGKKKKQQCRSWLGWIYGSNLRCVRCSGHKGRHTNGFGGRVSVTWK